LTQVGPYPPRRVRRAGEPLAATPPAGQFGRPERRPGPDREPAPAPASTPGLASVPPQHSEFDLARRGSHATKQGQGFSWMLGWTILGTLVPGAGLLAAGRRTAGRVVLGLVGLALLALAGFALTGNLRQRGIALAVNPQQLLLLAVAAGVIGAAWIGVILATNVSLGRYASLTTGQRAFSSLVVVSLIAAVALPAFKVGDYALITRSVITNGSVFAGDKEGGSTAGPSKVKADPWADKPQMNVLLIGSDAGADRTGIRPDTLILASINTKTGKTAMFSIPRSLQRAPFPEGSGGRQAWPDGYYCPNAAPGAECLINAIWQWAETDGHQYYKRFKNPGLRATEDAVEGVTGLKVDTYVMLNIEGFRDFVNALHGVTVDVHERLPIGGNSHYRVAVGGWIEKGDNQHLSGYKALWFARSRWSTTDYDRMQRQRCVIGAMVDQTNPLKIARGFPALAKALKHNLSTGISSDDLEAWVTLAERIQKGGVTSLVFDPDVISTVNPDFDQIHSLVDKAVAATAKVKKPTVAATPAPGATPTKAKKKATTKKPLDPSKAQSLKSVC
jgi:polyisoprenyl-teichoic acid--peptidoglycan teichoic acid transferase